MRVLRKEEGYKRFSAMPYCTNPSDSIPPASPDSKGSVSAKGQGQWGKGRRTDGSYRGAGGGGRNLRDQPSDCARGAVSSVCWDSQHRLLEQGSGGSNFRVCPQDGAAKAPSGLHVPQFGFLWVTHRSGAQPKRGAGVTVLPHPPLVFCIHSQAS